MEFKMDPMTAAFVIATTTDALIRLAAHQNGVTVEEMKLKIAALQPRADSLEDWLRLLKDE
jgi:hypothetical protein